MRVSPGVSAVLAVAFLGAAAVLAIAPSADGPDPVPTALPTAAASSTPSALEVLPDALPTPTPSPTATTAPPTPADRAQVTADLSLLLADPEYATGSTRSVTVLDSHGRVVVEESGDLPLLPASTMKLLTAAAVLELHGADGRIRTPVLVDGPVTSRGTLAGSVYLLAAGDPSLATEEYQRFVFPARPAGDTSQLVDVLRLAGIEGVRGDVVVDPGPFADQRRPEGWRDVYLSDFDARFITGMTVDAGLDVTVNHPRAQWAQLRPEDLEDDGIVVDLARDPVVHSAEVFLEELARARMSAIGDAVVGQVPPDARQIGELLSPRVRDLLTFMVKQSDNPLADTLLREVGAVVDGRSTWASSAAAVRTLLAEVDVDLGDAHMADGSGLSRSNLVSSRVLARLDQVMSASRHGAVWADLQAVAGQDGTLAGRLRGTIAAGRFRGKTGTLNDVRALVGAVEGPTGERYHLAILGNGGEVWRINTLADQLILRLTRSLWCGVEPAPADVAIACVA